MSPTENGVPVARERREAAQQRGPALHALRVAVLDGAQLLRGAGKWVVLTRTFGGVDVRLLRESELEEVIAIWHGARKETHTSLGIEAERGVTLANSRQVFREVIVPRCEIWVAEREEELLGFLAIRGSYIDRMYVRPETQREGVGTALLRKAQELSPSGLELHTHDSNHSARDFYEKHGFRAVAFGVSPPPESEPDVEYQWRPA